MSLLDWSAPFERLETGARFRSRGRTITETDLVCFAALTGDRHPQHTDEEWSRSSRFGERIAHGMLIVSYAVGLLPLDPERVIALRRISEVVFKRPVTVGQTIHVDGRIEHLRQLSEQAGLVGWRWDVRDGEDLLVCRAQVQALWATGTAAGEGETRAAADAAIEFTPGVFPC